MYDQNLQRILSKALFMTVLFYFLFPPAFSANLSIPIKSETGQVMRNLRFLKPRDIEDVIIQIEVADTPSARSAGLQGRIGLGKNKGMLFVFPETALLKFWMKKTLIPLDIIYVSDDYKIVDVISDAQPCRETPCMIYPSTAKCRYAIEVNAGFTKINDIKAGDKVNF